MGLSMGIGVAGGSKWYFRVWRRWGGGEVRGFWKLHCTQLQQFSKAQCTVASIPDCSSCAYIHYVHVVYSMWIKHCVRTLFKAYTMLKSTVLWHFLLCKIPENKRFVPWKHTRIEECCWKRSMFWRFWLVSTVDRLHTWEISELMNWYSTFSGEDERGCP